MKDDLILAGIGFVSGGICFILADAQPLGAMTISTGLLLIVVAIATRKRQ